MAVKIGTFERDLRVAVAGLSPQAINALLARTAKHALADAIVTGAGSPSFVRAVNGQVGMPEEAVRAPGAIVYSFSHLDEVALYALEYAKARSPKLSGRFKASWFAMVDGKPWDRRSPIPAGAQVTITNDQPYARKIEVGAMRMSLPPHVAEDTRQAIQKRYGELIRARMTFVKLSGGYRLKSNAGRKGRRAGDEVTYPAIVIDRAV